MRVYPLSTPWARIGVRLVAGLCVFALLFVLGVSGILDAIGRGMVPLVMAWAVTMGVVIGSTIALVRRRHRAIELHRDRIVVVGRAGATVSFSLASVRVGMRTASAGSEVVEGKLVPRPAVPLSLSFSAPSKYVEIDTAHLRRRGDARELAALVERAQKGDQLEVATLAQAVSTPRLRVEAASDRGDDAEVAEVADTRDESSASRAARERF